MPEQARKVIYSLLTPFRPPLQLDLHNLLYPVPSQRKKNIRGKNDPFQKIESTRRDALGKTPVCVSATKTSFLQMLLGPNPTSLTLVDYEGFILQIGQCSCRDKGDCWSLQTTAATNTFVTDGHGSCASSGVIPRIHHSSWHLGGIQGLEPAGNCRGDAGRSFASRFFMS